MIQRYFECIQRQAHTAAFAPSQQERVQKAFPSRTLPQKIRRSRWRRPPKRSRRSQTVVMNGSW
jgi:hypothetical protein